MLRAALDGAACSLHALQCAAQRGLVWPLRSGRCPEQGRLSVRDWSVRHPFPADSQ